MGPVLTQEFAIKDCSDRGNDAAPDLHEPRLVARSRRDTASIRSRPPRQAPRTLRRVTPDEHLTREPPGVNRMDSIGVQTPSGLEESGDIDRETLGSRH